MKKALKNNRGILFVISGPSGSGKTTLATALIKDKALKKNISRSVSFTTRPKRSGEKNGRDYFFVSEEEFKRKLRAKKLLEWTKYLGYYYATSKEFIEERLKTAKGLVLCLDLNGAIAAKKLCPENTVTIFILPPAAKELYKRIVQRSSNTRKEEIERRLKLARAEVAASKKYDYRLVNRDFNKALQRLKEIIRRKINLTGRE